MLRLAAITLAAMSLLVGAAAILGVALLVAGITLTLAKRRR